MPRRKKCKVFVSYSRHDEALVKPLAGLLGAINDAVFLDVTSLAAGDLWEEKIIAAVRDSSVFIICWCCASNSSVFIEKEIATALEDPQKRLVPVLFCEAQLPLGLRNRQWIDLRGRIAHQCVANHVLTPEAPDVLEHRSTSDEPEYTFDGLDAWYDDGFFGSLDPEGLGSGENAAGGYDLLLSQRKAHRARWLWIVAIIAVVIAAVWFTLRRGSAGRLSIWWIIGSLFVVAIVAILREIVLSRHVRLVPSLPDLSEMYGVEDRVVRVARKYFEHLSG